MIIKSSKAKQKRVGVMKIKSYKINPKFSGSLIEINGEHGKIKCLKEDRIYFIIRGGGKFVVNGEEYIVSTNDLIFIPKNTPYNIKGKMKYFLICSPEFRKEDDILL